MEWGEWKEKYYNSNLRLLKYLNIAEIWSNEKILKIVENDGIWWTNNRWNEIIEWSK